MASVYKSNVMKIQGGVGEGKLRTSELGGRVRVAHGTVTPEADYAADSVIELVRLPKGARILPESELHFAAGQEATATVKVGDSKNDARYLAAVAPGAEAKTLRLDADALNGYALPEEDVIRTTVGTAALKKGVKIVFDIFYVTD